MSEILFALVIIAIIVLTYACWDYQKKNDDNPLLKTVYFDNNATTIPPPEVKYEIDRWIGTGNPSSVACPSNQMVKEAKDFMYEHFNISPRQYDLVWTSGASESNALFIRSVVENYKMHTNVKPHVVVSSVEHKSILELCRALDNIGCFTYSVVEPDIYGQVCPADIEDAINHKTCLVSIMWANNELGTINNIPAIAALCKRKHIPFHTDATQAFGKFELPLGAPIDGVSISFHKAYGPPGIGLLAVHKRMKLHAQIGGMQNGGLRGGTENVPGIAGAVAGLKYTFGPPGRAEKNARLALMRQRIIDGISEVWPLVPYDVQLQDRRPDEMNPVELTILGPSPFNGVPGLPNTLLLSIVKNYGHKFCNIELKNKLQDAGILISIGSACNTGAAGPSHVLKAVQAPFRVSCGTVRVSLGDQNTMSEVEYFIKKFVEAVKTQLE
jgi:cysteine desulfurase